MKSLICNILFMALIASVRGVEPNEVILNEVYFCLNSNGETETNNHFEAVELLVVADKINLNGLQISDRNVWRQPTEGQCSLNDLGRHFLSEVRSGTLVVVYNGHGTDDTDPSDFVLQFYVKSSLFCNASPTGDAFRLYDQGDNLHVFFEDTQIDFLKYGSTDHANPRVGEGSRGNLSWEHGVRNYIDVGAPRENAGCRFIGDSPQLNDFLAAWRAYPEVYIVDNNLGKPNGGRNTEWINLLRSKAKVGPNAKATESAVTNRD